MYASAMFRDSIYSRGASSPERRTALELDPAIERQHRTRDW